MERPLNEQETPSQGGKQQWEALSKEIKYRGGKSCHSEILRRIKGPFLMAHGCNTALEK